MHFIITVLVFLRDISKYLWCLLDWCVNLLMTKCSSGKGQSVHFEVVELQQSVPGTDDKRSSLAHIESMLFLPDKVNNKKSASMLLVMGRFTV